MLLIEDDIDDQEIFLLALEDLNKELTCEVSSNGIAALELLSKDSTFVPGFIFLDLNLPKMSGQECLAELKKINRLHDTRIIIYTTSDNAKDKEQLRDCGAYAFITKPPTVGELVTILRQHLH